jgi:aspartate aminotransferase
LTSLSPVALAMPASGIREILELAINRPEVIRLEIGEPDFPTPAHIAAGAARGVADGFTRYTSNAGLASLRQLVAAKVSRLTGFQVGPEWITVTTGGTQAIFTSLLGLVSTGDEVLLADPGWPNFEMAVLAVGAVPVRYPLHLEHGFIPQLDEIEALITPRTRLLIVNSPGNPTGAVFPAATIAGLVALAQRHDLWLLADEVYGELVFEGRHVSPLPFDPERVVSVNSLSKTYAMTGWRAGYIVSPPQVTTVLGKMIEPQTACVAGPVQKAAEAALAGPQDCVTEMREAYRERRDAVLTLLERYGLWRYRPEGAFYLMLDIAGTGLESREFALRLLHEERVAVAPGSAFGDVAHGQVRISLATERGKLLEAVERACRLVRRLTAELPG